jgi:hypothetical protein
MSEVRQSPDGGRQQPSASPEAGETPWLDNLTVLGPSGALWGWSRRWKHKATPKFEIVVVPRLCLAQKPTYQLVHMRGYLDVFQGCRLHTPHLPASPRFSVLGAVFSLYKTGRPELNQMVMVLRGSTGELSKIIELGTDLLT